MWRWDWKKMRRGEIDFEKVDVGARLLAILKKMLEVQPEDRYQSVQEVLRDIAKYRDGALTSVDKSSVSLLALSLWRRNKAVIFSFFGGFVFGGGDFSCLYSKFTGSGAGGGGVSRADKEGSE